MKDDAEVQLPVVPGSNRENVEAFLGVARHALHAGGMDASSRESVASVLTEMSEELEQTDPQWTMLEDRARALRSVVERAANPAVARAFRSLSWP